MTNESVELFFNQLVAWLILGCLGSCRSHILIPPTRVGVTWKYLMQDPNDVE